MSRLPKPIHCLHHTFGTNMAGTIMARTKACPARPHESRGHRNDNALHDVAEGDKRDAVAAVFGWSAAAERRQGTGR